MTTAYTPLLQLALPVTGELDGTWGDTVNDAITSMVEEAIAGIASVSTWAGASHVLTTASGSTSEARCAVLILSGAPGAAATVITPATTKVYLVTNNVTGGYAATVKVSGQTGVSVPNGTTMLLYCNGTDIVEGVTNFGAIALTGKTITTPTFAGKYTEGVVTANTSTAYTVNTANGTMFFLTLTGNCTYTFPTPVAGQSFVLFQKQDGTGSRTATWPGTVKWPYAITPILTITAGATDKFVFSSDGTSWFGATAGQGYA